MYGGFIVPPTTMALTLGVLFRHKDGFSTACGYDDRAGSIG
jgi:proline racemase